MPPELAKHGSDMMIRYEASIAGDSETPLEMRSNIDPSGRTSGFGVVNNRFEGDVVQHLKDKVSEHET